MRRCAAALWSLLPFMPAFAQDSREAYLAGFDRDGDGRVSLAEYLQYMGAGFDRMDTNGDDVVAGDELPGRHGRAIRRADYRANLTDQFRRLDRNHDGRLDARELTAPPG